MLYCRAPANIAPLRRASVAIGTEYFFSGLKVKYHFGGRWRLFGKRQLGSIITQTGHSGQAKTRFNQSDEDLLLTLLVFAKGLKNCFRNRKISFQFPKVRNDDFPLHGMNNKC